MRLRACLGIALFALAGCGSVPGIIRIDVDGSTLEFKKKEPPAPDVPEADHSNAAGTDAPRP